MKSTLACLVLFVVYCSCEQLLGGWSTSTDESLKYDCLQRGLNHIRGERVGNDVVSQASELVCKTQIVNGLNIKCEFNFRGQKWQCSYYKSFIQTLETQLEQCKELLVEEQNDEGDLEAQNEGDKDEEQVPADEDEEAKDDDQEEQQQQAAVGINQNEQNDQVAQEALIPNEDEAEQDDEAQIDDMNRKLSEQNGNNDDRLLNK